MSARALLVAVLGFYCVLCGCKPSQDGVAAKTLPAGKLLLVGATIVDTRSGTLSPHVSILMEGGRIVRIAPASEAIYAGASVKSIDARGKFVIPGYLDMHAHVFAPGATHDMMMLMLANGITGFRQMSGSPELLKDHKDGTLPISGIAPELLAMPGALLTPFNAWSPDSGVAAVKEQKTEGADFIKVILVNSPTFFAAQTEAKRLGLPFVGHLPPGVDIVAASKGGMRSIEHLGTGTAPLIPCSTDEAALRAEIVKSPPTEGFPFSVMHLIPFKTDIEAWMTPKTVVNPAMLSGPAEIARIQHVIVTFNEDKCRRLAEQFVTDGTWEVPTLIRLKTSELADDPEFSNDPNLRYMPPDEVKLWRDVEKKFMEKFSIVDRDTYRSFYALHLKLVKLFDETGVRMMTGDDAGGAEWVVPGFALHQEFDEFARAGVPPLHILQDATINPAEFLGHSSSMGTVEVGKNADLVVLDANPIDTVQNMHKIDAVIRAGHYFSRRDLDGILDTIQAEHARGR